MFKKIKLYFEDLINDLRAARRGERRVGPRGRGLKGRIYEKADAGALSNVVRFKRSPKATLTMRVLRADGTVETITVPAVTSGYSEP